MALNLNPRHGVIAGRSPAIWIYPTDADRPTEFKVSLTFKGKGFMTSSTPDYNDEWRVRVDLRPPFYRYSSIYGSDADSPVAFLDYDGFRDGDFQTTHGWCIPQENLIKWQREQLKEIGYLDNEIDDVNYTYARMLLSRKYTAPLFAIYPQQTATVDKSVELSVSPQPDSIYRLWLYFVPVKVAPAGLQIPSVTKLIRKGTTVVELAYLTKREIPHGAVNGTLASTAGGEHHDSEARVLEKLEDELRAKR
jgi:hypothetical protein